MRLTVIFHSRLSAGSPPPATVKAASQAPFTASAPSDESIAAEQDLIHGHRRRAAKGEPGGDDRAVDLDVIHPELFTPRRAGHRLARLQQGAQCLCVRG